MELRDKVVVVTGAASGIGAALCRRFAREGARAVIAADLNGDGAKQVAAEFGGVGMQVNVAAEADVVRMVRTTEKEFGGIDLLCSNAGIGRNDTDFFNAASATNADFQLCFEVNVMAHVYAARAALPKMIERGHGYFLQTASAAGLLSQIGSAPYSITKHAAIAFGESLAIAHADQGIKVSMLCPQAVRTPMLGGGKAEDLPQSGDGVLEPEDVAESVIKGLAAEQFLILPHPEVKGYVEFKTANYDKWLRGMTKLRRRIIESTKPKA